MATGERTRREAAVAGGGAAAAALAIAYSLYCVLVVYPRPAPPGPWVGPVLTNLGLYAAFALHHSVFARDAVRTATTRLVGGHLERSVYVWTASGLLAGLCWAWQAVPAVAWDAAGAAALPFHLCQIAGALMAWRAARLADARDLVGLGPLRSPVSPPGTDAPEVVLTTDGPYRWVRHPMYAGVLLIFWAVPTMTATGLLFAAATTVYVAAAVPFEERSLRRRAPAAYDAFARAVRWRLVPLVY